MALLILLVEVVVGFWVLRVNQRMGVVLTLLVSMILALLVI